MESGYLHVVVKEPTKPVENPTEIVCLHGWNQSHRSFSALAELLAPYARLHLVDLPGFGDSPAPPEPWGTEQYAARVIQHLDTAGISKAVFIGHSFGGRTSLRIAKQFPGRCTHLVLMGSHGLKRKRTGIEELRANLLPKAGKLLKKVDATCGTSLFEGWFVPRYGSRDYKAAGSLRGTLVKTVTEDQSAELPAIFQPALLLWGALDTETPVEMAHRFHAGLKNSELIVLDGRGHDCFMDIDAHLCAYYIRDFLSAVNPCAVNPCAVNLSVSSLGATGSISQ